MTDKRDTEYVQKKQPITVTVHLQQQLKRYQPQELKQKVTGAITLYSGINKSYNKTTLYSTIGK